MAGFGGVEENNYASLQDLKVELRKDDEEEANGCFTLCFWLYIHNRASFPSVILHQKHPEIASSAPFLWLNEKKKMTLFPLYFLHQEALDPDNMVPWMEVPGASTEMEFPEKKWVHVGCEVLSDILRLHVDGEIVGEKRVTCSLNKDTHPNDLERTYLARIGGNEDGFQAYVYGMDVLSPSSPVEHHYVKDPPVQLAIDHSSASEIEEDSDGAWSIVGGKASCRRIFSMDVILLDAFGHRVNKELEVVASLFYADNDAPVENTTDSEAPLLTSCDGIEFSSQDRPCKLTSGRASFKLKISQLSSKCDNRLFRIRFDIPKMGRYPFFETLSFPIRCVSRSRNARTTSTPWRKASSGIYLLNGSQSHDLDDGPLELLPSIVREAKPSPSSKRIKLGQDKPFTTFENNLPLKQAGKESNSHVWITNKDNNTYGRTMDWRPENYDRADNCSAASDSSEETNSDPKSIPSTSPISDLIVFKYCLGGPTERSDLLKEIAISASEEDLAKFSHQVSLFSGCSHHRRQIIIAKRLVEEGMQAWTSVSQSNHHVLWENLVFGINECFMKITGCSRPLTYQDFECLRRIAGCQDLVSQENFEKMWCWLYPVAFTLSTTSVNAMWSLLLPKWMEGFITKEEAESALQGPGGLQDPGTFVLRFPTSRSWPHPDAGSLVVTYVGSDYTIHHRLLSLDFIDGSGAKEMPAKPLQDMLLEEPELSRLGRVSRSTRSFKNSCSGREETMNKAVM